MAALLSYSSLPQLHRAACACLMAVVLSACSSDHSSSPSTVPAAAVERGAQIYATSCIACHQADGHGVAKVYPSLAASAVVTGDAGALARWVIKGQRPAGMPAGRFAAAMPQYGWLKDDDAAALLTHLRSGFGNQAAPVTRSDIAQALVPR